MSTGAPVTPMSCIYSGRQCVGFILKRGHTGYEAFDSDEQSLGTFATQREAADVVSERGPR
jgi:hypothetical protein